MAKIKYVPEKGDKEDQVYGMYIGEYIMGRSQHGSTLLMGKLLGIREGTGYLCPHSGTDYTGEKPARKLIDDVATLELRGIGTVIPQTKKNIEAFLKYLDEEDEREEKARENSK